MGIPHYQNVHILSIARSVSGSVGIHHHRQLHYVRSNLKRCILHSLAKPEMVQIPLCASDIAMHGPGISGTDNAQSSIHVI